jgi:hypothetical protein
MEFSFILSVAGVFSSVEESAAVAVVLNDLQTKLNT